MLQKEFFQVQPYNPNPYWEGTVVLNLSGASKHEGAQIFYPGRYRIEVAPGGFVNSGNPNTVYGGSQTYFNIEEEITVPFKAWAYCGGNASNGSVGTNPYSGTYKVDGKTSDTQAAGTDVNHIFGAGGGNYYTSSSSSHTNARAGGNCLGNGSITYYSFNSRYIYYGAGSCLHLVPVNGNWVTDYIRAYHAAPTAGVPGSAYGGGAAGYIGSSGSSWGYRGGNSPYGTGATTSYTSGNGIGSGKVITESGTRYMVGAGARFNGTQWIDVPGNITNTVTSLIKITYLGPLS